jgi:hypothetical protein
MSKNEHHVESGSKLPHSKVRLRNILVSRAAVLECGASAPLFFAPLMCASIYDAVYSENSYPEEDGVLAGLS